ncbi:MAG TPA: IS110 family transposase [Alphaproteobacteria bacterium]|nr:IS110 family transposase [Alphaproteobacteria bacterium]
MSTDIVTAIRSPSNTHCPDHVVAFEVSKRQLVVHTLPADRSCTIPNTSQAIRRVLQTEIKHNRQAQLGAMLVVCEATGGYETHVLDVAVELGLDAHKAHGSRVRNFAKYKGFKAKNDPIDARLIALYGMQTEDLVRYQPPSAAAKSLRALQERRDDLKSMLQAETNRLEHASNAHVLKSLNSSIAALAKTLAAIEAAIALLLRSEASIARKAKLMRTVPGVGPTVAATLIAHMPELGTLSRGRAAALAGLAPFDNDSGNQKGHRHIGAGRSAVRRCLYMAALAAVRTCPHLREFATRVKARGKPFKVAITAVMRKLIVMINAVLASQSPCRYTRAA